MRNQIVGDINLPAEIPVLLCSSPPWGWVNEVPNDDTTIKRKFDVNLVHFAARF